MLPAVFIKTKTDLIGSFDDKGGNNPARTQFIEVLNSGAIGGEKTEVTKDWGKAAEGYLQQYGLKIANFF